MARGIKAPRKAKPWESIVRAFWYRVNKQGPVHIIYGRCWSWTGGKTKGGYGSVYIETGPGRSRDKAHRISYKINVGPIPDGMMICHHCDNPNCVNPKHLFAGTAQDNIRDCVDKGRGADLSEEKNNNAKYTREIVTRVHELRRQQKTHAKISEEMGMPIITISQILHGSRWPEVKKEFEKIYGSIPKGTKMRRKDARDGKMKRKYNGRG